MQHVVQLVCGHALDCLSTLLVQVDALTRRSAAVATRIAQKEKEAGSDLDTLRVCLAADHAGGLSEPAL